MRVGSERIHKTGQLALTPKVSLNMLAKLSLKVGILSFDLAD